MPEPPASYHPRCEINHQRKDDAVDEADAWPAELRIWHSLVLCYPDAASQDEVTGEDVRCC